MWAGAVTFNLWYAIPLVEARGHCVAIAGGAVFCGAERRSRFIVDVDALPLTCDHLGPGTAPEARTCISRLRRKRCRNTFASVHGHVSLL